MVIRQVDITGQMELQLQPFIDECERRGYPVTDVQLRESIPGVYNSFVLDLTADWIIDEDKINPLAINPLLRSILRETTPKEVHRLIHAIIPDLSEEAAKKWKVEYRAKYGQSN
ncbi:MAG: hypothetical protein LBF88_01055 [Planctomycetaceae bacterium]|jgi:hypothetical protein|nr:hypothetical protein [Planctomycetaceae bacterium]